jgi:anhydro-N-acetylmuramic acid kinase
MAERSELWIGLISGTSADGIDAALVRIGDEPRDLELLSFRTEPFEEELRARIHGMTGRAVELRGIARMHREIGERSAQAALAVAREAGIEGREVTGIGSHGQTVGHFPESDVRGTVQLGCPSVIHARTGIPVVSDFRSADLTAGGEGAPLTPFFHHACLAREGERRAVLNIGGFTNVTFLDGVDPEKVVAFDPGPGNALIDRATRWASEGSERFDTEGRRARRGRVHEEILEELLRDPYFALAPPKSTGHEHFGEAFFEGARKSVLEAGGTADDVVATLTALTVRSVVACRSFSGGSIERWLVYGGGAHNRALLEGLRREVSPAPVESTDEHGVPGDALEAITFAVLGWASARGRAGNLPRATGARRAVVLGSATPPSAFGRR